MLAAALAVAALIIAVVGLVNDLPVLGLGAAAIAAILGAAVMSLLGSNAALQKRLHTAEHEVTRLQATVVDDVASRVNPPAESDSAASEAPESADKHLTVGDTSDLADTETGLLGERYFVVTLEARVAAARRHLRPLALVLLEGVQDANGTPTQLSAKVTADIIRETLRDADTLCRLSTGQFAILLEDTPENGAIWTVERIRRRLAEHMSDTTVWAGIACYPANGFDGPEVLDRARAALSQAREWQQDRTEVADA